MEKMQAQRNMRSKKTRDTNKVSKMQNVEKPIKRGVGRPKKQKDTLGEPYMKVIYVSGNHTEEVEFSPDKPLTGTSYTTQVEKDQHRALWFVLGVLVGGSVVYAMARLALGGLR